MHILMNIIKNMTSITKITQLAKNLTKSLRHLNDIVTTL